MTNEQAKNIIEKYLALDSDADSEYIEAQKVAVKALEQEPCEDAVSRKVVDQNIYDYAESNGLSYANLKNAILDVPSVTPTQRWIPISERLPKVEQRVIFGMNNGAIYIGALHMLGNDLKITLEPTGIGYVYSFENVIAWMPLPQPYKAESEG